MTEDEYFGTPAQRAARQDRFADHKAWRERTGDTRVFVDDLPPDERLRASLQGDEDVLADALQWKAEAEAAADQRGVELASELIDETRQSLELLRRFVAERGRRDRKAPRPPMMVRTAASAAPAARGREGRSTRRATARAGPSSEDGDPEPPGGWRPDDLSGAAA